MRPLFLFAIYGVAFAAVTIIRATADANNPAHELAQKFAVGDLEKTAAQPPPDQPPPDQPQPNQPQPNPPQLSKPQPKPVVTAPLPPAVTSKAETKANPPVPAIPAAAAPAAKAVPKLAQSKPRPPAPGPDYERDMLDAARAEAEARQKPQTQQLDSKPAAETAPAFVAAPPATATAQPSPPPPAPAAPAPVQAAAPVAQAPTAPPATPQIKIEAKVNIPAPAAPAIITRPDGAPRATILAVLTQPAQNPSRPITPPDPVICLAEICYISAGPNADAKLVSRADALSTKNTVTSGAGACKGMNRCAFRGVSMKPGDEVQIVDLGIVGHDKREPADVTPDKSCHVDDGDLVCEHPVTAPDYRIWVVPETIAASAGPGALEAALADDLPEEDIARTEDK